MSRPTKPQLELALGLLSGRVKPYEGIFETCKLLFPELVNETGAALLRRPPNYEVLYRAEQILAELLMPSEPERTEAESQKLEDTLDQVQSLYAMVSARLHRVMRYAQSLHTAHARLERPNLEEIGNVITRLCQGSDAPTGLQQVQNQMDAEHIAACDRSLQARRYVVDVVGCTPEQADQVMAERLGYDEDYGFAYQVDYKRMSPTHPAFSFLDE